MQTSFKYNESRQIKSSMQSDLATMSDIFNKFKEVSNLASVWTGSSASTTTGRIDEYVLMFPKFERSSMNLIEQLQGVISAHEKLEQEQSAAAGNL